jgi:hypothetical protein
MKKISLIALFSVLLLSMTAFVSQNTDGDRLLGVWEPSNGRARVKVEKIGDKYFGRIVWLKEPVEPTTGENKTDKNNPDAALQKVSLKGYRMLKDFVYQKNNAYFLT